MSYLRKYLTFIRKYLILLGMGRISSDVKKIFDWVDNKPAKEAWLIAKAPIRSSSFSQMRNGSYKPGPRMIRDCFRAIDEYKDQAIVPSSGGKKAPVT